MSASIAQQMSGLRSRLPGCARRSHARRAREWAIISGGKETAGAKLAALRDAGIEVAENNKAPAGCLQRGLVDGSLDVRLVDRP
jgi:succinyl-CoA synthetase alpha subunit